MQKIKAVIVGASGYTGAELLRLLLQHPHVEIKALVAESNAGKEVAEIYPNFTGMGLPSIVKLEQVDLTNIDVAFFCLPHATSQKIIKTMPKHLKIIDLSADFRIQDIALYEKWYGEHFAKDIQPEAVYGLPEFYREQVKFARIIACPGCYPTSMLLPLLPLVQADIIDKDDIFVDSKSGVTGAGRSLKQNLLFTEANEGITAYGLGGHRHSAEIAEQLNTTITFIPNLVPMNRGISSTIFVKLKKDLATARAALENKYKNEPFVKILSCSNVPATHNVRGTNYCYINIFEGQRPGTATIISVIDNLNKGSSGQAVQNMNIAFGLDETLALTQTAIFP